MTTVVCRNTVTLTIPDSLNHCGRELKSSAHVTSIMASRAFLV
jgi:hypothetical protein